MNNQINSIKENALSLIRSERDRLQGLIVLDIHGQIFVMCGLLGGS